MKNFNEIDERVYDDELEQAMEETCAEYEDYEDDEFWN